MKHAYIDRISSSKEELVESIDEVARLAKAHVGQRRHQHKRYPYAPPKPIHVEILQPGGNISRYVVHAHDLSDSGMGVFHGGFIYPDSHCYVHIVTHDAETFLAEAKIVRCECIRGRVHFVGIQFAIEIDACDVLGIQKDANGSLGGHGDEPVSHNVIVRRIADLTDHEPVWPDVRPMVRDIQRMLDGEEPELPIEHYATEDRVAILDPDGKILRVNPAWCELAVANGFKGHGFRDASYAEVGLAGEAGMVDPQDVHNAVRMIANGADVGLQVCVRRKPDRSPSCFQLSIERTTAGAAAIRLSAIEQADE